MRMVDATPLPVSAAVPPMAIVPLPASGSGLSVTVGSTSSIRTVFVDESS